MLFPPSGPRFVTGKLDAYSALCSPIGVIPGHRKPQQLAEQKRHRLVVGQAKGQESGGKVGASMGIFLSIPRRRVGHLGAAGPERSPVPLGSAVRRAPRGLCIPMPAVYS